MLNLFNGQSVLLVGLGESGLACARWMLAQGATLTVIDSREQPPGLQDLKSAYPDVALLHTLGAAPWGFNRVVVSPGLPPHHDLMQSVLAAANAHETPVDSELDLFADALLALKEQRGYEPKLVGVTGTNGKTTTVRMVECLCRFAGQSVVAAGNISPAALDALRVQLESDALPQVWVLELSSFQLHWTTRLRLNASTVLNITQDHLDWHVDMQAYVQDKFRIFTPGATCVLNRDDELVCTAAVPNDSSRITFGVSAPVAVGDYGLTREGGMLWLSQLIGDPEATASGRRKKVDAIEPTEKLLMPTEALLVAGLHNASNALAALALCESLDLPMAKLLHGLRNYRGEPHRVEHVLQLDGVDFFDDSKGTNVGATVAAILGLARATVLIAGGDGKGQNFEPLAEPVSRHCKAVVLIGKDAERLAQALGATGVPCLRAKTLPQAVSMAFEQSVAGGCVLLSPACASLDMFKNYVHRAEVFVQAVRDLAEDRGQPC